MLYDNQALGFGAHYIREEDGTLRRYLIFDDAIRMDVLEAGMDFEDDDTTVKVMLLNPKSNSGIVFKKINKSI